MGQSRLSFRHYPIRPRYHLSTDADREVQAWCNDSVTTRYMATGRRHVTRSMANWLWGGPYAFLVVADGVRVGVVGLYELDRLSEKAELRIILGAGRGQGIGTAAVRWMLDYGFRRLRLWRIYLGTAQKNEAAVRCFYKCGFVNEALLVDDLRRDGFRFTNVRMAILRPAWEAQRR